MKLVVIPSADGDSFAIVNEKFAPSHYIPVDDKEVIRNRYDFNDVLTMLISFNKAKGS